MLNKDSLNSGWLLLWFVIFHLVHLYFSFFVRKVGVSLCGNLGAHAAVLPSAPKASAEGVCACWPLLGTRSPPSHWYLPAPISAQMLFPLSTFRGPQTSSALLPGAPVTLPFTESPTVFMSIDLCGSWIVVLGSLHLSLCECRDCIS